MIANHIIVLVLLVTGTLLIASGLWLSRSARARDRDISSLMYSITHDELSNPVQSAMTAAENIERQAARLKPENEDLHDLKNALLRLQSTTRNLRMLALMDVPQTAKVRERINAVAVIQNIVIEYSDKAKQAGVRLIYEGDDTPLYVLEQMLNLHRIFGNVIDNAIKYSTGCTDASVVVSVSRDGRYLSVDVSDNGVGMSPDRLAMIGRAPQRPTAQNVGTQGSGLGMYLVKRIVRQAGGSLQVQSQMGKGSHVRIRLPLKR